MAVKGYLSLNLNIAFEYAYILAIQNTLWSESIVLTSIFIVTVMILKASMYGQDKEPV